VPELIRVPGPDRISPLEALEFAFHDTLHLLFSPFEGRRWFKLSIVCLFLGGGTASAAFHWSLGKLPAELGFREAVGDLVDFIAGSPGLILSIILLGLGLSLILFYLRSVFRFVLVDTIVRGEAFLRQASQGLRRPARSYFIWLLGVLVAVGTVLGAGALLALPHLRTAAASSGTGSLVFVALLAVILLAEMAMGILVALLITLTDDLVVPVMYSEGVVLPAAWKTVWKHFQAEPKAFGFYVLLRFVASVVVGAAVLLFLFPALVAIFSGAIISGALVVLTLRLVGVAWVWNPLTLFLASLGLLLLMTVLLLLMSVVGMPGQVFLQSMGVRFIASRVPSLGTALGRLRHP